MGELKAEGICLLTNYGGRYLGDPKFDPVFEELNRRGAVVYVHPTEGPCTCGFELPAASLEYPFDTTRAIASLLFSGTFSRARNIKFIFSHAGGTIPFIADRLARLERRPGLCAPPAGRRASPSSSACITTRRCPPTGWR